MDTLILLALPTCEEVKLWWPVRLLMLKLYKVKPFYRKGKNLWTNRKISFIQEELLIFRNRTRYKIINKIVQWNIFKTRISESHYDIKNTWWTNDLTRNYRNKCYYNDNNFYCRSCQKILIIIWIFKYNALMTSF